MKLTNNHQYILDKIVNEEKESTQSYTDDSQFFEFFSSKYILKNEEVSDEDVENGLVGGSNDGGCDSIYILHNGINIIDGCLHSIVFHKDDKIDLIIIQSKRCASFGEDTIMKWRAISKNLLKMNISNDEYIDRYSSEVLDKFSLFRELYTMAIAKSPRLSINYYYVTYGDINNVHDNVKSQAKELKEEVKALFPSSKSSVVINFLGACELVAAFQTHIEQDLRLPLAETPINIGENKDFVALVKLSSYYKFLCDEKDNLRRNIFEYNVRDYQGHNSVNQAIEKTLNDSTGEDFWWLNNGITLVADEVNLATNKEIVLRNPSIVNGLQTSTEIYNFFYKNKEIISSENRNILVRIIVPSDEMSRDRIILATNNQTSIPKSSLRANDEIHWQIELFLKKYNLFYDRRKNYYKNLGKKSHEIVSVSFLAQCMISLLLAKPNYARARPSTLLSQDDIYKKLYNPDQHLYVFCNAAILGKKVDQYLKRTPKFTQAQRNDILFYVLYYSVAFYLKKQIIEAKDIIDIDISNFTDEYFKKITKTVFNSYITLGGNGKVAKGNELLKALFAML